MQGRRPIPTVLKLIAGNPGKRPLNENEPKPDKRISVSEVHQGEARKEWRRMSKKLSRLGLLTEIDRAAMALYCRAWEVWNEAVDQVRKSGNRRQGAFADIRCCRRTSRSSETLLIKCARSWSNSA